MPRRALTLATSIVAIGLLSVAPASAGAQAPATSPSIPAFDGDAMWIWLMTRSEGGSAT